MRSYVSESGTIGDRVSVSRLGARFLSCGSGFIGRNALGRCQAIFGKLRSFRGRGKAGLVLERVSNGFLSRFRMFLDEGGGAGSKSGRNLLGSAVRGCVSALGMFLG